MLPVLVLQATWFAMCVCECVDVCVHVCLRTEHTLVGGGALFLDGGKFDFNLGLNKKWSYLSVLD